MKNEKKLHYYQGEAENPYLRPGEVLRFLSDYDIMANNPKAYWWWFEKNNQNLFDTMDTTLRCFVYKHTEYAPISSEDMIKSYYNNIVCQ